MQLGRAIIGAIIGAAIGIAIMVVVYLALGFDKVWMALPVAILTGLGVRTMVATGGHASYVRGAITGLLALAAYLVGGQVVAMVMQHRASTASESTRIERPADDGNANKEEPGTEVADEEKPAEAPKAPPVDARPGLPAGNMKKTPPTNMSTVEFIILCVSALIAYELGRGTAPKSPVVAASDTEPPPSEVPHGAHPDA